MQMVFAAWQGVGASLVQIFRKGNLVNVFRVLSCTTKVGATLVQVWCSWCKICTKAENLHQGLWCRL